MEAQVVMSKFLRVKMSPIIKHLLESLPKLDIEEISTITSIYTATGSVMVNGKPDSISISIWTDAPQSILIAIQIGSVSFKLPFNNKEEFQTICLLARREILNRMN